MRDDETAAAAGGGGADEELTTDLDVEMALLALSARDMGEPTESFDLGSLSPTEKRVLLDMLRQRLYGSSAPAGTPGQQPQPESPAGRPADAGQAVA